MAILEDIIGKLAQTQERLLTHLPEKRRDWLSRLQIADRAALLIGPRCTGKTTWLLSQVETGHLLYFSSNLAYNLVSLSRSVHLSFKFFG